MSRSFGAFSPFARLFKAIFLRAPTYFINHDFINHVVCVDAVGAAVRRGTLLCLRYYLPARACQKQFKLLFCGTHSRTTTRSRTCERYIAPGLALPPVCTKQPMSNAINVYVDLSWRTKARDNSTACVMKQAHNKQNQLHYMIIINYTTAIIYQVRNA